MSLLAIILAILGFVLAVVGAIRMYRGRMREEPEGSGLYAIPTSNRGDLVLTIVGAAIGLAGGVVGALQ